MNENKFCVKCGEKISGAAEFCPKCGAKQSDSMDHLENTQNTQQVIKQRRPWYKRVWSWIAIVLVGFILIVSIASCSDSGSDSSSSQSTSVKKRQKKSLRVLHSLSADQLHERGVANAQKFRYGQLIKSNSKYAKPYAISKGEVLQANENHGKTSFLIFINEDENQLFKVGMSGKSKAIEGDYVSTDGVLDKITNYDTQAGGSNTVPSIFTKKVNVVGHDSDEG